MGIIDLILIPFAVVTLALLGLGLISIVMDKTLTSADQWFIDRPRLRGAVFVAFGLVLLWGMGFHIATRLGLLPEGL